MAQEVQIVGRSKVSCQMQPAAEPLMKAAQRVTAAAMGVLIGCLLAGCQTISGGVDRVINTAVSPDGRTLAASTVGEKIILYDVAPLRMRTLLASGRPYLETSSREYFEATGEWTRSAPLAFSPDGRTLVAAGVDGHVVGWDVQAGSVRFRTRLDAVAKDVVFQPDGGTFFVIGPGIHRFGADTGARVGELKRPGAVSATSAAVSPDGRIFFAGLSSGEIAQYETEVETPIRVMKGHVMPVTGVAVSPDGSALASTAGRFDPKFWDLRDDPPVPRGLAELQAAKDASDQARDEYRKHAQGATVILSPALLFINPFLIAAVLLEEGDFPAQAATSASAYCPTRIAYSPNGRFVATTALAIGRKAGPQLILADVLERKVRIIPGIFGCSIAISADSKFVITGGPDEPRLWDAETGEPVVNPKRSD